MRHSIREFLAATAAATCLCGTLAAPAPSVTDEPAKIRVDVAPQTVAPGERARVSVTVDPVEGVKVNRYPKMRFSVPAREGLVAAAEATLGDDRPPPIDQSTSNYFDQLAPLSLELTLDREAPSGTHEVEGQLVFYYCVTRSGFCAPKKTPVKIALSVR